MGRIWGPGLDFRELSRNFVIRNVIEEVSCHEANGIGSSILLPW